MCTSGFWASYNETDCIHYYTKCYKHPQIETSYIKPYSYDKKLSGMERIEIGFLQKTNFHKTKSIKIGFAGKNPSLYTIKNTSV